MKYWSSFYSLVVIKNRNSINSLVAVAKKRKMTNIPGTKLNMDDTIDYAVKEFTSLANDKIQVAIMDVKEKVNMSNFSAEAYKYTVIHISDKFDVDRYLPSTAYSDILLRQADNYARK